MSENMATTTSAREAYAGTDVLPAYGDRVLYRVDWLRDQLSLWYGKNGDTVLREWSVRVPTNESWLAAARKMNMLHNVHTGAGVPLILKGATDLIQDCYLLMQVDHRGVVYRCQRDGSEICHGGRAPSTGEELMSLVRHLLRGTVQEHPAPHPVHIDEAYSTEEASGIALDVERESVLELHLPHMRETLDEILSVLRASAAGGPVLRTPVQRSIEHTADTDVLDAGSVPRAADHEESRRDGEDTAADGSPDEARAVAGATEEKPAAVASSSSAAPGSEHWYPELAADLAEWVKIRDSHLTDAHKGNMQAYREGAACGMVNSTYYVMCSLRSESKGRLYMLLESLRIVDEKRANDDRTFETWCEEIIAAHASLSPEKHEHLDDRLARIMQYVSTRVRAGESVDDVIMRHLEHEQDREDVRRMLARLGGSWSGSVNWSAFASAVERFQDDRREQLDGEKAKRALRLVELLDDWFEEPRSVNATPAYSGRTRLHVERIASVQWIVTQVREDGSTHDRQIRSVELYPKATDALISALSNWADARARAEQQVGAT